MPLVSRTTDTIPGGQLLLGDRQKEMKLELHFPEKGLLIQGIEVLLRLRLGLLGLILLLRMKESCDYRLMRLS